MDIFLRFGLSYYEFAIFLVDLNAFVYFKVS